MPTPSTPVRPALYLGLALLVLASALGAAAPAPGPAAANPDLPGVQADGLLYVCNQDEASVTIIDVETREIVRTVDLTELGFSENARPHHLVVEPDGSHWYVSLIGEGLVVKLDRNHQVVGTAPFETPGMLALHSERGELYVARSMTAVNPPARIGMIDTSDMSIEEIDIFFPRPHALVLEERSGIVYTASLATNQIAAVDPETERAIVTDVEGPPHALMQWAVSPDGSTLAISGEISHTLHLFDLTEDPLRPRHLGSVPVGEQPFDPIFTADGRTVWLGNKMANTITGVDVETQKIVAVIEDERIRQPHGAAATSDGRWVFISNTNVREPHDMMMMGDHDEHAHHDSPQERIVGGPGSVAVIDARTGELVDVIQVGRNATGIGLGPR